MTFLSFLSKADFVASLVVDATVLYLSFVAYRRTRLVAFALLVWSSLISIISEVGLHLRTPTSAQDAVSFHEWYRVGYLAQVIIWGIAFVLIIRYVQRHFEQKSPPNTELEPTATAPSVSDKP